MVSHFDATKFLDVARHLSGLADEEYHRTALGRAYYSVFIRWREDLANELGIHAHSLNHGPFVKALKRKDFHLANLVQSLQERRICGDYRTTNPAQARQRSMKLRIDQACAGAAIKEAEAAHKKFRALYP